MSQPKGRSGGDGSRNKPQNQQPQPKPVNFADADAFGPPLGARGNSRKNYGAPIQQKQQQQRQHQQQTQLVTSKPTTAPQGNQAKPTQSKQDLNKNIVKPTQSGKLTDRFEKGEKSQEKDQRGKINRDDKNDLEPIKTKPEHVSNKRGTTGRAFMVKSNYFTLNSQGQWQVFHYRVDFKPEIENAAIRNALLVQQRPTLGGFLYDRGSSIYLIRQLDAEMEFQTRDREGTKYLIQLKRVGLISALEIQYVQVLNIIMKKALQALNLQLVGRDYFDPKEAIKIPEFALQLWPGYSTSIRQHERNILLNCEIKHKLMRDESLLAILARCINENRQNWQQEFMRLVLGSVVLTKYNNKTYRITDVDFQSNPKKTFETKNDPISYIDYYKKRYGLIIRDTQQPLLVSKPTERSLRTGDNQIINLIPELCYATGYTDQMRKNFKLMQATATHTRVGPSNRITRLLNFNERLQSTPDAIKCIKDWLLNLSRTLADVPARGLPAEEILLGSNIKQIARDGNWSSALQGRNSMHTSIELINWTVIMPNNLESDTRNFIKVLLEVSRGMRFNVAPPEVARINDDRTGTISTKLMDECQKNKQLIMVVVSNNSADRYSTIKKMCYVRNSCPSQVVTSRIIDPRNMSKLRSVATKVAIQMNAKIGGQPWQVDVKMDNIMFIGYDVCHDTQNRSNSYGAVVATMDMRKSGAFFSAVSAHTNGEELSNNLAINVKRALIQYHKIHKTLPARILFYRDGVGEGQTNYVYHHELKQLLAELQKMYGENPVKLAFVVVSKRINTKFFAGSDLRSATNVPAGTVVDDVVTLPERYDYFIVSQAVTQGTATPTNYNVLYDTFGLPPDKLQMMTYKLCHLYWNYSGTTRVPAVCQYAHKLAFLVGNYLHQSPSTGLEKFLYFL